MNKYTVIIMQAGIEPSTAYRYVHADDVRDAIGEALLEYAKDNAIPVSQYESLSAIYVIAGHVDVLEIAE